jgi:hypothetical protein
MNLPIFNYAPLEKLHDFVAKIDSDEARELLSELRGEEGCCWGNPCYHKACLACFCRGNLKFLTASQAYVQAGLKLKPGSTEWEGRQPIIRDEKLTKEDLLPYREHFTDYFFEKLP